MNPPPVYIDVVTAVEQLTADVPDDEITDRDGAPVRNPATLTWRKREQAITLLYAALCEGALTAWVRLPSGEILTLINIDWKVAKLWRDIIAGGVVRVLPPEEIARYDGARVLLDAAAFEAWRVRRLAPPETAEATPDPVREPTKRRKSNSAQLDRAKTFLKVCYPPDGIPPDGTSDTEAHHTVTNYCEKANKSRPPSKDSVARARRELEA